MCQLFLSLTSLFNAHLLPRALSTSPETLLTTLALLFFPFALPHIPSKIIVGDPGKVASLDMRDTRVVPSPTEKASSRRAQNGDSVVLEDASELNYVTMDRMTPQIKRPSKQVPSVIHDTFADQKESPQISLSQSSSLPWRSAYDRQLYLYGHT